MMESTGSAADQMADASDSFDSLSDLVSNVSEHDSTSRNVQPLDGTSPADEGNEMEEAGGPDSGIGSSIVDNHGPSQTAAAGDSQASGAAGNTATIPGDPFSNFAQDFLASVPKEDVVVSVPEQSRPDDQPLVGRDPDVLLNNMDEDDDEEAAGSRGVEYGGPDDVDSCAKRIDKIKDRSDVEGQDGVLVDNEILRIADNRYRENSEYDRVGPLGEGSRGTVNLIQDRQSQAKAVEKRIPLNSFHRNEPINWCRLDHPFIVGFQGLVRTGTTVGYFSKYNVDYETLERIIQRGIPIETQQALSLIEQLFQALDYIHTSGIVHGDIHEGNILINASADRIRLKMIDFGDSQKISEGHDYRRDVKCAIEILKRLLGVRLGYDNQTNQVVDLSDTTTDERLFELLSWAVNEQPTAADVLKRIRKLIFFMLQ